MTIYEKLSQLQNTLKVPKNQYNEFGKYYFRNCDDIMEATKPLCKDLKCLIICDDDLVQVGERYYICATAKLIDLETSENIRVHAFAREEETKKGMDASQITGSTSSYARKYALNGLLQLDDTKDADSNEYSKVTGKTGKKPNMASKITPAQVQKLQILLKELGDKYKEALYKQLNINSCKELSFDKANELIKSLSTKVEKKKGK